MYIRGAIQKRVGQFSSYPALIPIYAYAKRSLIFPLLLLLELRRGRGQSRVGDQDGQVAPMHIALHEPIDLVDGLRVVFRLPAQVKLKQVQGLHVVHCLSIPHLLDWPDA